MIPLIKLAIFTAIPSMFLLVWIRSVRLAESVYRSRRHHQTTRRELISYIRECRPNVPDDEAERMRHMSHKQLFRIAEDLQWNDTHLTQEQEVVMSQDELVNQEILNQDTMARQMADDSNPYLHPGLDVVIDHDYHGIPNGMGTNDFPDPHQGGGFDGF